MKIYTRTGDAGSTGLFGGRRVSKDDDRIEAYGTVDELNAAIGTARSAGVSESVDAQLHEIQNQLFSLGAELASPAPEEHDLRVVGQGHIEVLERWIDEHESGLPELKQFILPAGSSASTHLHLARAICRRAERRVVTLAARPDGNISADMIIYLNRLSDLLFVLTRVVNREGKGVEVPWARTIESRKR